MNKIFEEIDSIAWGELSHAYGEADDVPKSLKALFSSTSQSEAENALHQFFGNIYHQGTIYSATSYAVPFLIQALPFCPLSLKSHLLELLICISNGMSYNIQHEHYWRDGSIWDDGRVHTEEYKEETKKQLHWVEQGILNVWQGWDDFILLLKDKDEAVRANVPLLLISLTNSKYFPSNRNKQSVFAETQELFSEQLSTESSALVRASLISGISYLNIAIEKKIPLLKYYLQDENPLIQIISAYFLVSYEKDARAVDILVQAAKNKDETDELFADFPWFDMRFSFSLLNLMCSFPMTYFGGFWAVFEKYIKETRKYGTEYTVSPIIYMVFGQQKIEEIKTPLSNEQKKVLRCILETPLLWDETDGNTSSEFRRWGLKRDKEFIQKLIAAQE